MASKKPKELDLYPLGLIGGAKEFENTYPDEMIRLGTLTAYWSLVEDSLCKVLSVLLANKLKAEAAFYSTLNHKARRDMVVAVAKKSDLNEGTQSYLAAAISAIGDAADSRNKLLHGLLRMEPHSGELLSVSKRPATKTPEIIRKNVIKEIDRAIEQCEVAVELLGTVAFMIRWPNGSDDFIKSMKKAIASRRKSLP